MIILRGPDWHEEDRANALKLPAERNCRVRLFVGRFELGAKLPLADIEAIKECAPRR